MRSINLQNSRYTFKFDAPAYLAQNPDLAEALQSRLISSPLSHAIRHGFRENRPGLDASTRRNVLDLLDNHSLALPGRLMFRATECQDIRSFNASGLIDALVLTSYFEQWASTRDAVLLDFGCGCGRVAYFMTKILDARLIHGCDIDQETIAWSAANYPDRIEFLANDHLPPLPYADDSIDLLYSVSIFTHLPESMQKSWLQELARIVKPGGVLLITTHGEEITSTFGLPREHLRSFEKEGYFYTTDFKTAGLPDFYGVASHSQQYVRDVWGQYFTILAHYPRGLDNQQDVVVCRKKQNSGFVP